MHGDHITQVTWCSVLIVCLYRSKNNTNHADKEQTAINALCFCANQNGIRSLSHFVSESDALFNTFVLKTKQLLFHRSSVLFCKGCKRKPTSLIIKSLNNKRATDSRQVCMLMCSFHLKCIVWSIVIVSAMLPADV